MEPKVTEINIIYPMTSLSVSPGSVHLGVGLKQGSVFVYDLILQQEKFYLDKHQFPVTHLKFCEDWRLVSAAFDGSLHIYDLRDGSVLCKRTN